MSLEKFFNNMRKTEIDLVWCHWNRLGVMGSEKMNLCSTDPEALILLTSIVGHYDLRLIEIMMEWLDRYEPLVSVERLKRYIRESDANKSNSEAFDILREVVLKQKTTRWKSIFNLLGANALKKKQKRDRNIHKKLDIHEKTIQRNLQLYLRLMFGVGTRADVIYYSLVVFEQRKNAAWFISAPQISKMLHYNNSSIHRTIHDLEQAGFLAVDPTKKIGKNKVYSLNFNKIGKITKNIFRWEVQNKHYVDWFKVVEVFLLIEQLKRQLEDISDDSIIKSRLQDYIKSCSMLMSEARIDIEDTFIATNALVSIGLDELESKALSQINSIYRFVTSRG